MRVSVLVAKNSHGLYAAMPITWDASTADVAVASSLRDSLNEIESFLRHAARRNSLEYPELHEARLQNIDVRVQPSHYDEHGMRQLHPDTIELNIPCVLARSDDGTGLLFAPLLGISLRVDDAKRLPKIAREHVRDEVAKAPVSELRQWLTIRDVELRQITVPVPRKKKQGHAGSALLENPDVLSQIAQPLNDKEFRRRLGASWQREQERNDLQHRLLTEESNILLLGDHGSGRTTLLTNAVRGIERESGGGQGRRGKRRVSRFWLTGAARLVAGMQYLGEWQQQCELVVRELAALDGVLCVESLIELVQQGGASPADSIAAFLLPFLEQGQLRMVAEATDREWDACRRLLPSLTDAFEVLRVHNMSAAESRSALKQSVEIRCRNDKIEVEEETVEMACELFRRFLPYRALPGAAVPLLNRLFEQAKSSGDRRFGPDDVIRQFVKETGVPETFLRDEITVDVNDLVRELEQSVLGQTEACVLVADILATFKSGMNDPGRPLGTLLWTGPTGVGKTELAKATARLLFGPDAPRTSLVRLDMSEYGGWWGAERLLMNEDGSPSPLIRQVRRRPFSVVLLDEIEKASPEVFDVLLSLLDEGRLTDRFGRTTNFCSSLIIMTSNLGASLRSSVGFDRSPVSSGTKDVQTFFRPEFFNRIDAHVEFQPLSKETCLEIVRKEIRDLSRREGLKVRNLALAPSDRLVAFLAEVGIDVRFGARPLQRVLESRVVSVISRFLIEHPQLENTVLRLDVDDRQTVIVSLSQ